jgi:hypothetical protein
MKTELAAEAVSYPAANRGVWRSPVSLQIGFSHGGIPTLQILVHTNY